MSTETTITQAVILAGGRGERLRPITDTIPKPMAPINGKPFLVYLVELLKWNGIKEIVMLLGYMPEKITEYFGDGAKFGVDIKYSIGSVEDDTGTRVRNAKDLIKDYFLMHYGDLYWPFNLRKAVEFYEKMGVLATHIVYDNQGGVGEYDFKNNMYVDENGFNLMYDASKKDPRLNVANVGFYIFSKKIFDLMPQEDFNFDNVITAELIKNHELAALKTDVPFYTITNAILLRKAEEGIKKIYSNPA